MSLSAGRINIAIPLRNVGNGLAVIVPELIMVVGPRIGEMVAEVQHVRVPPGETTRIICAPRLSQLEVADYPWPLEVRIPYSDFIGGQAAVAIVQLEQLFAETEGILRNVTQDPPDEDIRIALTS